VAATLAFLILVPTLVYAPDHDQGVFLYLARALQRGFTPYRDAWDNKPPLIYLVYSLFTWPSDFLYVKYLVRLGDIIAQSIGALCAATAVQACLRNCSLLSRRAGGIAAGIWSAVLYASQGEFQLGQAESFASVALIAAAALSMHRDVPLRGLPWLAASGLFGMAFGFKPTMALPILCLVYPAMRGMRRMDITCGVLVFITVASCPLIWLLLMGGLAEYIEIFTTYLTDYASLGRAGLLHGLQQWSRVYFIPLLLGGAALPLMLTSTPEVPGARRVMAAALGTFVVFVAQGKGLWYHLTPLLPLLAVMIGVGTGGLCEGARNRRSIHLLLMLILSMGVPGAYLVVYRGSGHLRAMTTLMCQMDWGLAPSCLDPRERSERRATNEIQAILRYGDKILVWGRPVTIYSRLGAMAPTRFFDSIPMVSTASPLKWRREFEDAIRRAPPRAVVVSKHDSAPGVTGRVGASDSLLATLPSLAGLLQRSYRMTYEDGFLRVYVVR
jgi:hypothetical protein